MDDDESVRKFALKVLSGLGHEAEEAVDGNEAIIIYNKAMKSGNPFDVVLMDLTIPGGMGGEEAIQKLLEIDPEVKAIVSSGYANDPVVANYLDYGFSGFLSKPYKIEDLNKVLNELLSGKN